jgi:hypothetical protein
LTLCVYTSTTQILIPILLARMPKYVIFLILANRPEAKKDEEDNDKAREPPVDQMIEAFLNWIKGEIKSERIKGGEYLLGSSEETNIRIDFHDAGNALAKKLVEGDGESPLPPPSSSVTRGHQPDMSTNVLAYYTAEFASVNDVIAWGQSCPISYDGFALEIRELQNTMTAIAEAPAEAREWTGDHIVSIRKKLAEEGKLKEEEDGTKWVKLEDEPVVKEIVAEAEEREAKKVQD